MITLIVLSSKMQASGAIAVRDRSKKICFFHQDIFGSEAPRAIWAYRNSFRRTSTLRLDNEINSKQPKGIEVNDPDLTFLCPEELSQVPKPDITEDAKTHGTPLSSTIDPEMTACDQESLDLEPIEQESRFLMPPPKTGQKRKSDVAATTVSEVVVAAEVPTSTADDVPPGKRRISKKFQRFQESFDKFVENLSPQETATTTTTTMVTTTAPRTYQVSSSIDFDDSTFILHYKNKLAAEETAASDEAAASVETPPAVAMADEISSFLPTMLFREPPPPPRANRQNKSPEQDLDISSIIPTKAAELVDRLEALPARGEISIDYDAVKKNWVFSSARSLASKTEFKMTFKMKDDEEMSEFLEKVEGKIVTFDPMEFGFGDVLIQREETSPASPATSPVLTQSKSTSPTSLKSQLPFSKSQLANSQSQPSSKPSLSFRLTFETMRKAEIRGQAVTEIHSADDNWTLERTIEGNTTSYDDVKNLWGGKVFKKRTNSC